MKLEFSLQIFEKSSDIKFHENLSHGSRVVRRGQTDRHDEANSRFSQICERAWKVQKPTWFTSYMITFVRFEVLPVATVMFTLKMEAADHYAAFVIFTIL